MRWRWTLLLCLAAALVVAAASMPTGSRRWRAGGESGPLLTSAELPIDRIDAIRIERPGTPALLLRRRGEGWIEASPSGLAADAFQVRDLIEAAAALSASRRLPAGAPTDDEALRRMGLDEPLATVEFSWQGGATTLRLGRPGVAGRAFVQRGEGGEIAVVGRELHELVAERDPRTWRRRSLFPDAGAETVALRAESSGGRRLELERRRGAWRLVAPVATRADGVGVEALLATLARAECEGFLEDLPAEEEEALRRRGLAAPAATLVLVQRTPEGTRERVLRVGDPIDLAGGARAGLLEGHPTVLRLGPATIQALFPPPAALVDPVAAAVPPAEVKSIEIESKAGRFTLRRELDRWVCPDAIEPEAARPAVEELLERLARARATSISLEAAPEPLRAGTILLGGFDGAELARIAVFVEPQSGQAGLDDGDGVVRIFPAGLAPALSPAAYGLTLRPPADPSTP